MYKPPGHNSLSPYLIVENARATLDFIKAVFGVEPEMLIEAPDGGVHHAEVRIDDTILMIGEATGGVTSAHIHVYVPNVDASFAKATAAGGKVVQEPIRKQDADRRGGVIDPSGVTWWLATTQESDAG